MDVETTGCGHDARIIEVGAVKVSGGLIADTFQTLIDPCSLITNSGIHGITDSMVIGAPRFESALPELLRFTAGSVFVAHNAAFDIRMLAQEQKRIDGVGPVRNQEFLCSVTLGRLAYPGLGSYRLDALTRALEIENTRPHEGLSDALATAEALIMLLARLKNRPYINEERFTKKILKQRPIFTDRLAVDIEQATMKPRANALSL